MLENISELRGLSDYNLMQRYTLMRVQINDQIVEKLVKPGTQLRFISFEELFDIVHEAHIEKGHSGRDIMQKHMSTRYSNVTVQH